MAEGYSPSGTTPVYTNPQRVLEVKILKAINAASNCGGGAGTGTFSGTGSPEGVVTASSGALYTDITIPSTPGFWTKTSGTGNTGWSQLIS